MSDAELGVEIDMGTAGDDEALSVLAQRLRSELADLDVDSVLLARSNDTPTGAKALDAATIGTLIVHLGARADVLGAVTSLVRGWIRRQRARSITLEIEGDRLEITGASSDEESRLIDLWVAKHAVAG